MTEIYSKQEHTQWLLGQAKKLLVSRIIFNSNKNNILLVKPIYRKTWQLPGGVVDEDESPEDAAVREVHEELGLTIIPGDISLVDTIYKKDEETLILIYEYSRLLSEDVSFELQPEEISSYQFISSNKATNKLSHTYNKFWVNRYLIQ